MSRAADQDLSSVISSAAAGDEVAFRRIVMPYQEELYSICVLVDEGGGPTGSPGRASSASTASVEAKTHPPGARPRLRAALASTRPYTASE